MDVIFYGAGKWGRKALDIYEKGRYNGIKVIGFADSSKNISYNGYPVIQIAEIRGKNINVIITVKEIFIVCEIYNKLKQSGVDNIYWFQNNEEHKNSQDFLKDWCISCSTWGECVLPRVEMHIADYCNLNCKGCTHFSPIFNKLLPDFEERMHDVKLLKQKFAQVGCFSILGGEPFLNPEIHLYVSGIRRIFPDSNIQIVTNGLLIPQLNSSILECIQQNKAVVSISEYEPTHNLINRIEDRLKEYNISYIIRRYESKQKFIKPLSLSENSIYPHTCISDGCVNIWNGKIARCPTLMYIERFNEKFGENLPKEGILQLEPAPGGFELLDILNRQVPLCRHCVSCEIEWEQCGADPMVTDFANLD